LVGEVAVDRKAEVEGEPGEIAVRRVQPVERGAQAQIQVVTRERRARLPAEDAAEMEGRNVEARGEVAQAEAAGEVRRERLLRARREIAVRPVAGRRARRAPRRRKRG